MIRKIIGAIDRLFYWDEFGTDRPATEIPAMTHPGKKTLEELVAGIKLYGVVPNADLRSALDYVQMVEADLAKEIGLKEHHADLKDQYLKEADDALSRAETAEATILALKAENERLAKALERDALLSYYERQIVWSRETFGPALRTGGVIDHIRKELREIEQNPHDLSEWIDVVILAMDGFWRHGGIAAELMPALLAKQKKNMARVWPDWRGMSEDSAIEHDRSYDALSQRPEHGEV